ncbi:MAG: ATP-dependent DNA helicase, partial [Nitrospirota bacterium]|nr:ATP-dependent DNA helicase [Nitrospirota bacterium]
ELKIKSKLLSTQLESRLWELVAAGHISADGFSAIRSLTKQKKKASASLQKRAKRFWGGRVPVSLTGKGRWALMHKPEQETQAETQAETDERWAWQLLERYGVFFRDLLMRESAAPAWRNLLPLYRRLEARGEIRGGRFITGVSGEQFALPQVVPLLRQDRKAEKDKLIFISASDPMNLVGILTPGPKVKASASNVLAYLGGKHVGHRQGKETWIDSALDGELRTRVLQGLRTA